MDTLIEILITAFSISYFIGAVDTFFNLGKLKGFIALPIASGIFYLWGYFWQDILILAPAATFVSLAIMMLLDRPQTIQTRRF
jgi:hypothetical protein